MKQKIIDCLLLVGFILAYIAVALVMLDSLQPQTLLCNLAFVLSALSGGCVIVIMVFLK